MQAINEIERSSYTDAIVLKTQEEAPTEAPSNVQVQTGGESDLIITWQVGGPARNTPVPNHTTLTNCRYRHASPGTASLSATLLTALKRNKTLTTSAW